MNVWRNRDFARLWIASFCSESAEWMLQIALPVLVYQLTGSAASTATMMIIGLLPAVLLSPLAGVLADRWNKRVLLCGVCAGQALVAVPLLLPGAAGVSTGYLVMAGQAALAALFEPTRNALVPELAGVAAVTPANGLLGSGSSIARLAGAGLGGTVFGVGGLGWLYAGYAATLMVALIVLLAPFRTRASGTADRPMVRAWLDGLGVIRRDRALRRTGVVLALMSVAQGMFLTLFVPFVLDVLHGGAQHVGLLRGVQAVGGLVAGIALGTVARRVRPRNLLGWGTVAFGVLSAVIWNGPLVSTAFGGYLVLLAAIGIPGVVAGSALLSVLQTAVPAELTGRVMSTAFAAMALCTAAGMWLAGACADGVGPAGLLNVQAGLYLLAGGATFALLARRTVHSGLR